MNIPTNQLPTVIFLKQHGAQFEGIKFTSDAITAHDVASLFKRPLKQILKTILLISKEKPILAVIPSNKKLSFKKLKSLFNQKDLRLASPVEIKEITGYERGSVSPFGLKTPIEKVIDQSAFDEPVVNFGAGTTYTGIEMPAEEFKRVWDGIIADISA